MRRRAFIAGLGSVAAWPVLARAQQRVPIIAILLSGAPDTPSSKTQMELLRAGMKGVGLEEGKDYVFETRGADSDAGRFRAVATELLALQPSVIVASTNLAIATLQGMSNTVPIVGISLNAPVAVGLVASLSHPGGNVTGVSTMADEIVFKSVEIMREILPRARKVTVILNPTNSSNPIMLDALKRQLATTELLIGSVEISSPADLDTAFEGVSRQHPDALIVLTDNSLLGLANPIITRATIQGLPTFANMSYVFTRIGGLVNYSRDPKVSFEAAARLLKQILNGAKPADFPVEQPTNYILSINLKTAKALGINIPSTLLARADEVIE
jgi:putative ABC transport system substrate-binding protein